MGRLKTLLLQESYKLDPTLASAEDYWGESQLLVPGNPLLLRAREVIKKEVREWGRKALNAVVGGEDSESLELRVGPSHQIRVRFVENRVLVNFNGTPLPTSKIYGVHCTPDGTEIRGIDVDLSSIKKELLNALCRRT